MYAPTPGRSVLWVDRSRLGHLAQATRENELRVQVLGLRPYVAKLIVFVVAGFCAALAGVAYMLLQSGTQPSSVGADLTITVLVMVVLGGVGFRWGAIVGGVLYTILDQRLTVLARSMRGCTDVAASARGRNCARWTTRSSRSTTPWG